MNLYEYVGNDPVGLTDPLGECWCQFNIGSDNEWGHTGHFKVNCTCKGKINVWVIDEHNAPAAAATCGTWIEADGFVMNGVTYKIDGSTCVELDCCLDKVNITTCVNFLAGMHSKPPYPVKPGAFGGPPKEPTPGSPEPPIKDPPTPPAQPHPPRGRR